MGSRCWAPWPGVACALLLGRLLAAAALSFEGGVLPSELGADSVPFFVYDLGFNESACPPSLKTRNIKIFPDWALHVGLQEHPWRTYEKGKAKLFYVPLELSAIMWHVSREELDPCWEYERRRAMEMAENILASAYFRRNDGKDHFTTAHHYMVRKDMVYHMFDWPMVRLLKQITKLTDDLQTRRVFNLEDSLQRVVVPYGDAFIPGPPPAEVPFWTRNHSMIFIGQADERRDYRARVRSFALGKWFPKSVLVCVGKCGKLPKDYDKCSEYRGLNGCLTNDKIGGQYRSLLLDSRFGLFFRGDTASSGRLYDYIASGVIPIIVSDDDAPFDTLAKPFKEDLPWDNFTFTISQRRFMTETKASISSIIFAPPAVLDEKLRVLAEVKSSLGWVSDGWQSRVPSLALRKIAREVGLPVAPADHRTLPAVSMQGLLSTPGAATARPPAAARGQLLSPRSAAVDAEDDEFWGPFWEG